MRYFSIVWYSLLSALSVNNTAGWLIDNRKISAGFTTATTHDARSGWAASMRLDQQQQQQQPFHSRVIARTTPQIITSCKALSATREQFTTTQQLTSTLATSSHLRLNPLVAVFSHIVTVSTGHMLSLHSIVFTRCLSRHKLNSRLPPRCIGLVTEK